MKRFLSLILILSLMSALVVPLSAETARDINDYLLIHYDFEGSTIDEALKDKATKGTTSDNLNLGNISNGQTLTNTFTGEAGSFFKWDSENGTVTTVYVDKTDAKSKNHLEAAASTDTVNTNTGAGTWFFRFKMNESFTATVPESTDTYTGRSALLWDLRDTTSPSTRALSVDYFYDTTYSRARLRFNFGISSTSDSYTSQLEHADFSYDFDTSPYLNLALVRKWDSETSEWYCYVYAATGTPTKASEWRSTNNKAGGEYGYVTRFSLGTTLVSAADVPLRLFGNNSRPLPGLEIDDVRYYDTNLNLYEIAGILEDSNFDRSDEVASATELVGYQINTHESTYDVRMVALLTDLQQAGAGFDIKAKVGDTDEYDLSGEVTTAFTSLLGMDTDGNVIQYTAPTDSYLIALTVKGIPTNTLPTFTVTPYSYQTAVENKIYGKTVTFTVQGNQYKNNIPDSSFATMYQKYCANGTISQEALADQALIEEIVQAMGNSAVFCVGSSNVLYKGMIEKLDPADYTAVATVSNSVVSIPAAFANSYFGTSNSGMVSLNSLCGTNTNYTLNYDEASGLAIVTPAGETPVTSTDYLTRLKAFFEAESEPANATEQTRVVIDTRYNYPEQSLDYRQNAYFNCYSPSVLQVTENGTSVLYASNEHSEVSGTDDVATETVIRRSADGGKTWSEVAVIGGMRFGELFTTDGTDVYIIGSMLGNGHLHLAKISTTAANGIERSLKIRDSSSNGPAEVLVSNGYVYYPGSKEICSAPVNDLFNAASWTVAAAPFADVDDSTGYKESREWFNAQSGHSIGSGQGTALPAEGNALVLNGEIYILYRVESQPYGNYAMMVKLSSDRTSTSDWKLINLPTTVSKFTIHYDRTTESFICISNWLTYDGGCSARNVLGISVSKDLVTWTKIDELLVDREMMNAECSAWAHAYQYPDWVIDGNDIVMVIRETTGYSNYYHDGKYCTFYRIKNFRNLITTS